MLVWHHDHAQLVADALTGIMARSGSASGPPGDGAAVAEPVPFTRTQVTTAAHMFSKTSTAHMFANLRLTGVRHGV